MFLTLMPMYGMYLSIFIVLPIGPYNFPRDLVDPSIYLRIGKTHAANRCTPLQKLAICSSAKLGTC